jgi:hypothetical protein
LKLLGRTLVLIEQSGSKVLNLKRCAPVDIVGCIALGDLPGAHILRCLFKCAPMFERVDLVSQLTVFIPKRSILLSQLVENFLLLRLHLLELLHLLLEFKMLLLSLLMKLSDHLLLFLDHCLKRLDLLNVVVLILV